MRLSILSICISVLMIGLQASEANNTVESATSIETTGDVELGLMVNSETLTNIPSTGHDNVQQDSPNLSMGTIINIAQCFKALTALVALLAIFLFNSFYQYLCSHHSSLEIVLSIVGIMTGFSFVSSVFELWTFHQIHPKPSLQRIIIFGLSILTSCLASLVISRLPSFSNSLCKEPVQNPTSNVDYLLQIVVPVILQVILPCSIGSLIYQQKNEVSEITSLL